MKVLKFGGTSVGSVESILNLKKIVEACDEPVVVVVSALGGITDKLIGTSKLAVTGDTAYLTSYNEMVERHHAMIEAIITDADKKAKQHGQAQEQQCAAHLLQPDTLLD